MEKFYEILNYELLGNFVQNYLIAFGVFLAIFIAFKVFKTVVVGRLEKLSKRTSTDLDDELVKLINGVHEIFYYVLSVYFPLKFLVMGDEVEQVVHAVFVIVVIFELVRVAIQFVEYWLEKFVAKADGIHPKETSTFHGLSLIVKIALWSTGFLLVLSNLGVDITTLIASLGIGGIAIALAVQNILGDMFSSFSIYFDKPFEIGDYITVGTDSGTVRKIGLKTTRLKTLQGEELVISNNELTSSRVQNFKKMKERRVVLNFGLVPEVSNEKIKKAEELIEGIIEKMELARFERVHFSDFGSFSLLFEAVYIVLTADFDTYMDVKEEVNLAIKMGFEEEGIEMSFSKPVHLS